MVDMNEIERLSDVMTQVMELLVVSKMTMRESTLLGVTVAISGLAENVPAETVVERFPIFVDMLNYALAMYQSGKLEVQATVTKTRPV